MTSWIQGQVCNGDSCSTSSDDDIPHIKVNGDHFTVNGNVYISVTKTATGLRTDHYVVTTPVHSGYVLGSFGKQVNEFNCNDQVKMSANYYVQAYDYGTKTWSNRITAKVGVL